MYNSVLVVGLGEIGKPLYDLIVDAQRYNVFGIDKNPTRNIDVKLPSHIDIIHICIGCTDMSDYVKFVKSIYESYTPNMLIINSTVPPTTTSFIADGLGQTDWTKATCYIAHSPIFGRHAKGLKNEMMRYPHVVGGVTNESSNAVAEYMEILGFKVQVVDSSLESEILKIMETTYAGWQITFFHEFHRLCKYYGANYPEVVATLALDYKENKNKPIWYPDAIGGHCIMPNIELLLKSYKAGFLQLIKESNDLRMEEMDNPEIRKETEQIKNIRDYIFKELGFA